MDAELSLRFAQYFGKPWYFLMVDAGYDFWMGNNRGTKYTNMKTGPGSNPESKEHWDFTAEDMGLYDLPAEIDKVLEVTGAEKLKYIGYSLGTMQMFLGLAAMEEEYFADRVSKVIAQAPCMYLEPAAVGFPSAYDEVIQVFQ